ncbi:MAG: hypothetical protein WC974_02105 [Thermoplasmata archaeon]
MKTYITMTFNSEGSKPSQVAEILSGIGFKPLHGIYDFAYTWGNKREVSETLSFMDQVHEKLKGCNVQYQVTTI